MLIKNFLFKESIDLVLFKVFTKIFCRFGFLPMKRRDSMNIFSVPEGILILYTVLYLLIYQTDEGVLL